MKEECKICKLCKREYPDEQLHREATSERKYLCDFCLAEVEEEIGKGITTE